MNTRGLLIVSLLIFASFQNVAQDLFDGKIEIQKLIEEVWYTDKNHKLIELKNTLGAKYNVVLAENSFFYIDTTYRSSVLDIEELNIQSYRTITFFITS